MKSLASIALLSFTASFAIAGSIGETPSGLIGQFRSSPKRVCVFDARGGKPACARVADVMKIERTPFGGMRDVKVTAKFSLPDSQICPFEGMGAWNMHERSLAVVDARTGCELSLVPSGRELRGMVVRPDRCSSACASRSWVEGVVFRRW
jgi:hypothetical protein